ncbi:MAG TPA: MFS transporter [Gemmataceae bacterium]|nr:MFS transporter [Gemmataceae bacterium]
MKDVETASGACQHPGRTSNRGIGTPRSPFWRPALRSRLSLLMFLGYAPAGAVLPIYSSYLQEQLDFSSMGIAVCCATNAIATICAPLIAGHIADRWIPAERLLGLCSLIAGLDLWLLAELNQPLPIFFSTLLYWLLTCPIWMLCATIGFTHLKQSVQQYGPVRLWGTIGWMATAWLVSYWFNNPDWLSGAIGWLRPDRPFSERPDLFRIGGLMSFALTAYTLTLPHTPPKPSHDGRLAPLAALQVLNSRAFFIYALCFFGVCITFPFGTQGTPLLLRQLRTDEADLPALLTIAQATEVVFLGLLPFFFRSLGVRGTVILGMAALTAGLAVQALASSRDLVASSLGFNGLVIAGVFVAGQVFANGRVHDGLRASVQSLLIFISGVGQLLGNLLFGFLRHRSGGALQPAFAVGAIVMAISVAVFIFGFNDRGKSLER